MEQQTRIPNELMDSLAHGVKLVEELSHGGPDDSVDPVIVALVDDWSPRMDGLRRSRLLTPKEAAELRVVVGEGVEYAQTCHYDDEADAQDYPEDYRFARQSEELMSFLALASCAS